MWCSWDSMEWELNVGSAVRSVKISRWCTTVSLGWSANQTGTCASVTTQMCRTQLAYIAIDRSE